MVSRGVMVMAVAVGATVCGGCHVHLHVFEKHVHGDPNVEQVAEDPGPDALERDPRWEDVPR